MIIKHSADIKVKRRKVSDQEIVERLVYSMVNEAARILEEGIAQRASDIDMVYLTGYGFPLHRGGPMFYADTVGLPNVVAAMKKYAKGRARRVLEAGAAAGQARQEGQDVQLTVKPDARLAPRAGLPPRDGTDEPFISRSFSRSAT